MDAEFKELVEKNLPTWLWPQKLGKEGAKPYAIVGPCQAKLIFMAPSQNLSVTIERTCNSMGGEAVRKSVACPIGGFDEWWPAIRTIACDCDEKGAWGKDS